jgi:hypothetical protein
LVVSAVVPASSSSTVHLPPPYIDRLAANAQVSGQIDHAPPSGEQIEHAPAKLG